MFGMTENRHHDALRYVQTVKMSLGNQKFQLFLNHLQQSASGSINNTDLMHKVSALFDGNATLLEGFMKFLPTPPLGS
jgi:histone deacetylase complex regulatory component SIN3